MWILKVENWKLKSRCEMSKCWKLKTEMSKYLKLKTKMSKYLKLKTKTEIFEYWKLKCLNIKN